MATYTPSDPMDDDTFDVPNDAPVREAEGTKPRSPAGLLQGPEKMPDDFMGILRMVHRSLRGRYTLAIMAALLLGALGAAIGWYKVRPVYRSEGLLRIAYSLPEVMTETDQNAPMQMFDAFMFSQRLLITSRRVTDMAVQDPIWKITGRRVPDQADRYFAEHLDVDIKPRGEFILISVRDEDPGTAAAAVTAVMNAYTELYNSQDKQLERQRTGVLEDRQTAMQGRVEQLTAQLAEESQAFGTSNLSTFYEASVARVMRLKTTVNEFELAAATVSSQPRKAPSTRPVKAATPAAPLTVDQIAATDPEMRRLLTDQLNHQDELERLLASGFGENHRQVINARMDLEKAKGRVAQYEGFVREFRSLTGKDVTDTAGPSLISEKTPEQLKADLDRLRVLYEAAGTDMVKIGNQQLKLQRMRDELDNTREQLEQLNKRAAALRTEGSLGGRLSVISSGEIPLSPERDVRYKFTTVGGLGGMAVAMAAMVGLGFLRGRLNYADESSTWVGSAAVMLGMLPDLTRNDAARRAAAAHAIHQIRVLLQARTARRQSSVYLITSSTSGEGKTSLAMSLALSSAACGMQTLLIDCDLVGQHLTAGLGLQGRPGLREALDAGTISGLVLRIQYGLRVLTTGGIRAGDAASISAVRLRTLIQEARQAYEIVIIDSGPLLGSLEAMVLANEVDNAILVVTKGQRHELVRQSMVKLQSLGLRAAGFVYNRAARRDFDRSPVSSTSSSRVLSLSRALPGMERTQTDSTSAFAAFGPLVQAIESDLAPSCSDN